MIDVAASLAAGVAFGALLGAWGLPSPAPAHVAGLAAIAGLFLGWNAGARLLGG